jgi:hypothetical protein
MSVKIIGAVVLAAVCIAIGGGYASHRRQGELAGAQAALATALKQDAQEKDVLAALLARGSAAEARADSEAARGDSLAKASRKTEIKYVAVKAVAPADCAPVVAAADSALSDAQVEVETTRAALTSSQEAAKDYQVARDSALASLARLSAAASAVHAVASPGFIERFRPKFVVAAVAGVNPFTGHPDAVVGAGLGWSF